MLVPCLWSPNTAINGAFGGITAPLARYGILGMVNLSVGMSTFTPVNDVAIIANAAILFIALLTIFSMP